MTPSNRHLTRDRGDRRAGAWVRCALPVLLLSGVFLIPIGTTRAEIEHKLSGRVQIGVAYDSNVLEEPNVDVAEGETATTEQDQALQLLARAEYRARLSERFAVTAAGRLGLIRYRDLINDSRVIGEADVTALYQTTSRFALGADARIAGRDYADSSSTRGFRFAQGRLIGNIPLGVFTLELTPGQSVLDYKVTPGQEQVGSWVDGALRSPLGGGQYRVWAGRGYFDFNRKAVRIVDGEPVATTSDQRDNFRRAGLEIEYLRKLYLLVGYGFLDNRSNSFGNAYEYHRVHLTFRTAFARSFSIGLMAQLEFREYAHDLSDFIVINFDSERENNNWLIGEIGKRLEQDVTLRLRGGWRRNESVFRDRYYDKYVASALLEWRF